MVVRKLPRAGSNLMVYDQTSRNEYDHQGRLINTYHKINTGSERNISNLSYNELGQLLTKKLHVTSGAGLQKTDYTYNVRGWLKKINEPDLSGGEGDFFGAELLYNEGFTALNGTAMYNGNISGIKWKNGGSGSTQKGYGFIYDQINRLTTSKYGEGTSYTTNVSRYDENLTYDKNGNIQTILRKGQTSAGVFGDLDNLTFTYTAMGNQVRSIGDVVPNVAGRGDFYDGTLGYSAQEYFYDLNGNSVRDDNKKMSTLYNYLNLPSRIYETNTPANKIEYVYTSAGEKLKQRLSTGTTLLYFGNYVYTLDGTANGIAVKYILTQEGRATNSAGTYTYEYFMKDHLGNTRVSFNVPGSTAVIVQQSDYYPFGMIHQPQVTATSDNRLLYNGKELQNNLLGGINLDLYDYGARFYDPQIGRFTTIDPASELGRRWSPYTYTFDNPMRFTDPDGMWPDGGPGDDPFFAARFVKTVMQDITIGVYNTVTWLGSMAQPVYNPVRSIATKVQGDDGYYQVEKTLAIESPGQRLAGVLDPIGVVGTFAGGGPAAFMAKSASGTSITQSIKSLRNSAVTKAWKQEQTLIEETGEGTRQWGRLEKAQLLEEGKVDGYVGHHINNVKDHPDMAGNPNNVEFVKAGKEEHLPKHSGNYQNKTTGDLVDRTIKKKIDE